MKKNKVLRLASVLMMACLLTTCVISGTFAKYVSTTSAQDKARVAYWGFEEPTTVEFKLFEHNDTNVIAAAGDVDLIAPGTSGSASLSLVYNSNGSNIAAPEVAYNYSVSVTVEGDISALDANPNFVWVFGEVEYLEFDDFAAAVAVDESVPAGELPDASQNYTIGWEWKFNDTEEANSADKALGNAADLAEITVTLAIVATQIN